MSTRDVAYIGMQWGLASAVALAFDACGRVVKREEWAEPLDLARPREARQTLSARLSKLDSSAPVLIAGMGVGVFEAPQTWGRAACPTDPAALSAALRRETLGSRAVLISPGLACRSPFGAPDILRGEEISALGLATMTSRATLLSVPGRHGKWVQLREGRIERFHTAMTVELHHLLATHSIVGRGWPETGRPSVQFLAGLKTGLERGALSRTAFELRSAVVAGEITAEAAADRAWGLLIGSDLADLPRDILDGEIVIAGRAETAELYRAGLEALGTFARVEKPDRLSSAGFSRLASAAGLVEPVAPEPVP